MRNKISGTEAKAWNTMLKKPQFTDYCSMTQKIMDLNEARMIPLVHRGKVVPNRFVVEDFYGGQYYGTTSERYNIVQHREVLGPVAEAVFSLCDENDVPFKGSIEQTVDGSMTCAIQIGEGTHIIDSMYSLVLTIANSYNQKLAVHATSGLMRLLCGNGMVAVQGICNQTNHKHTDNIEREVTQWENWFKASALDAERNVEVVIPRALEIEVPWQQLEPMYRGMGIKARTARKVVDGIEDNVPEISKVGLNVWTAYNGLTQEFSHRTKGSFKNNTDNLALCGKLPTASIEEIARWVKVGEKMLSTEDEDSDE